MPKPSNNKKIPLKWPNPRGIGLLEVRHFRTDGPGWLCTSVGTDRHKGTGIRWPEDDGSKKDRLGLTEDQRSAYNDGMEILKKRVLYYENPELRPAAKPIERGPTTQTLGAAITEFKRDQWKGLSESTQKRFQTAFHHYLLNEKHGDMVLEFDALRKRISMMKDECPLAPITQQKALYKLSGFLDYCIDCSWLDRNPMKVISVPKSSEMDISESKVMELQDIARMFRRMRKQGAGHHVLFNRFLLLTGMRPAEALKARWSDISAQSIKVYGKKVSGRKVETSPDKLRSGCVRYFPLVDSNGDEVMPGLLPLLESLRKFELDNGGWLFPWRSTARYQAAFKAAVDEEGIHATQYWLRSTANWLMREKMRWGVEFRSEVLGHSVAVQIRHYNVQRRESEIIRAAADVSKSDQVK